MEERADIQLLTKLFVEDRTNNGDARIKVEYIIFNKDMESIAPIDMTKEQAIMLSCACDSLMQKLHELIELDDETKSVIKEAGFNT